MYSILRFIKKEPLILMTPIILIIGGGMVLYVALYEPNHETIIVQRLSAKILDKNESQGFSPAGSQMGRVGGMYVPVAPTFTCVVDVLIIGEEKPLAFGCPVGLTVEVGSIVAIERVVTTKLRDELVMSTEVYYRWPEHYEH